MSRREGRGGREGGGNGAVLDQPPSRMREVTSRGDGPTVETLAELVWAGTVDVVTGGADRRDVAGMCRGVQTFVSLARNQQPVDDLCERVDERRHTERERRTAQLRAELAALEAADRPLPPKG